MGEETSPQEPQAVAPGAPPPPMVANELAPISKPPGRAAAGHGSARKAEVKVARPTWVIYAVLGAAGVAILLVVGIVLAVKFLGD